jgi:hypothetical protein
MQLYATNLLQETAHPATEAPPLKKPIDYHVVFFFINAALVIIGYGLAYPTNFASLVPMKVLRILVLAASLFYLFNSRKSYTYIFKGTSTWVMWIFFVLHLYVLPFSVDVPVSVTKFVNIIPYFFYLNYFIIYLYRVYEKEHILNLLLNILNIIYALPILSYVLFGGNVQGEDIYGQVVGGFVSNHYGWTSAVFLTTSLDLIKNYPAISKTRKVGMLAFVPIAFYVLLISGSRSSYLTFILSFLLFIIKTRNTSIALKVITVMLSLYAVVSLYGIKESALNKRLEKTETQLEKGDARTVARNLGFDTMVKQPFALATGFGFFAYPEAMLILNPKITKIVGLHNSYLELFFGSGVFIFAFFLVFFVIKTLWKFGVYHSARYVFLPPIMIIPLFENNFNPGQFLFFPWFAIMFYYIHYNERQIKIDTELVSKPPAKKHQFL